MLSGKDTPKVWDIHVLFPGLSDKEIAEKLAGYFNRISQEFPAIGEPSAELLATQRSAPEMYAISGKLKKIRKPNSTVAGDIPPALINEVADILAIPLHYIFEKVYTTLQWP